MTTEQIYTLVNDVSAQAFGSAAVTVLDVQGLISLGNTVLSSTNNTEEFLNVLAQRIGKTIISFRMYTNKLSDLVLDSFQWGAILQKIRFELPQAESDESYGLTNGSSVDHYKINKMGTTQKLFVTRTPYQFHITIPRYQLREAFLSEDAMGAFLSAMFGQVRNMIETTLENLGRLTLAAGVSEVPAGARAVNLVTDFNNDNGTTLTATSCLYDSAFLRYAIRRIKEYMDNFTDMSSLYNDGTIETFTPYEEQRLRIVSKLERCLETVVEWAAFNEEYVKLTGFTKLNFWQGEQSPLEINVNRPSDGTAVNVTNLVAILHDREALGVYQEFEDILTTPVNAAGAYYNQYWHRKDGRMLDKSENLVYFTLN